MTPDLLDYLKTLTTPEGGIFLYAYPGYDWGEISEDECVHAVILTDPAPEAITQAQRVLKPGGHLLLVSPEDEPTGHTGACLAEDMGFEVRDAILVLEEAGGFHYVPKAASSEREAGLSKLEKQEGNERANHHPTIKPVKIMERLLDDVPEGATVVDPFMGSGTTGIAALAKDLSFIGIEKQPEYMEIADARIRHWREAKAGWKAVVIKSDLEKPEVEEAKPVSMEDFFGFGGPDE